VNDIYHYHVTHEKGSLRNPPNFRVPYLNLRDAVSYAMSLIRSKKELTRVWIENHAGACLHDEHDIRARSNDKRRTGADVTALRDEQYA
jgi:hypothetical protein